ncbi:MAG: hypothetical protein R3C49_21770 [Planctomycetaceae bacterium]
MNVLGQPEAKPITTGHWDFKPSWSKTGDHLVFFRRLKNDPVVSNWITQLCIINADGSGFHASPTAPLPTSIPTDATERTRPSGTARRAKKAALPDHSQQDRREAGRSTLTGKDYSG